MRRLTATTLIAISSDEQRMFQFCEAARRELEDRAAGFSFAVVGALTAFVMNTLRRAYVVMRAAVVAVSGWFMRVLDNALPGITTS